MTNGALVLLTTLCVLTSLEDVIAKLSDVVCVALTVVLCSVEVVDARDTVCRVDAYGHSRGTH